MSTDLTPAEPEPECTLCPRLVDFRKANQQQYADYFNGAVHSFGPESARLLIVGLAPGLHGANQTGRPFTGDYAGDLLYPSLVTFGFAEGQFDRRPDDGLQLIDCMITNAVRCVPPANKPTGAEINQCRPFLRSRIAALPDLKTILCLGRIAHDSTLRTLGARLKDHPFGHAASHKVGNLTLFDSYHCSRYNVNTGRLTEAMFHTVLDAIRSYLDGKG